MPPVLTIEADVSHLSEMSQTRAARLDQLEGEIRAAAARSRDLAARAEAASFALLEQLEGEIRALLRDPSGPDAQSQRRRIVAAGVPWGVADCVPSRGQALAWWAGA